MIGAVLAGPRDLGVRELSDPEPGFGEVRVRVARAGLCGSDVHVWKTGEFVTRFPVVPGHEVAGVVDKVGEGCEYLASRRVVLDSRVPCRSCAQCLGGQLQRCPQFGVLGEVCNGGFAQSVVVPGDRVWTIPDGLPLEAAVLAEPTAVALHAWSRLRSVAGDVERIAILGAGPIGVLQPRRRSDRRAPGPRDPGGDRGPDRGAESRASGGRAQDHRSAGRRARRVACWR